MVTLLASAAEWEGEDLMCDWRMVAVRRNGCAMRFEQQEQQKGQAVWMWNRVVARQCAQRRRLFGGGWCDKLRQEILTG